MFVSYLIVWHLNGKTSFESPPIDEFCDASYTAFHTMVVLFCCDPWVMVDDVYDTLIEYFTSTEEYEKCAEILNFKNSLV